MDNFYMNRALELAKKGKGFVNPNPMVGAVLVKDGQIIGEGWHEYYGGPHAEVNAIKKSTASPQGAILYVSLEPCCHHGKTPPCTELIIKNKISQVIVAMEDPNPKVAGQGIAQLQHAGIKVTLGIMEDEARDLNKHFLKHIGTGTPYVLLKTAMTMDGKTATYEGDSRWISGEGARSWVHQKRHEMTGIMVGIGTVLADNPRLDARRPQGLSNNPTPIIIDPNCRIPADAALFDIHRNQTVILVIGEEADHSHLTQQDSTMLVILRMPLIHGQFDLKDLMGHLGKMGIDSILLEGGSELNASALEAGIVDEIAAFVAPKVIGGRNAKTPVGGKGHSLMSESLPLILKETKVIDKDVMIRWKVGETSVHRNY